MWPKESARERTKRMASRLKGWLNPVFQPGGPKPYLIYNQVATKILISLHTFISMRLAMGWGRGVYGWGGRVLPFIHPEQRWVETGFNLLVLASSWVDVLLQICKSISIKRCKKNLFLWWYCARYQKPSSDAPTCGTSLSRLSNSVGGLSVS